MEERLLSSQQLRQGLRRFRQRQKAGADAQLCRQRHLAPQSVGIVKQDKMRHAALAVGEVPGAQLRREEHGPLAPQRRQLLRGQRRAVPVGGGEGEVRPGRRPDPAPAAAPRIGGRSPPAAGAASHRTERCSPPRGHPPRRGRSAPERTARGHSGGTVPPARPAPRRTAPAPAPRRCSPGAGTGAGCPVPARPAGAGRDSLSPSPAEARPGCPAGIASAASRPPPSMR